MNWPGRFARRPDTQFGRQAKHLEYIQYLIKFWKNKEIIQALINFVNEAIAIIQAYSLTLALKVCLTAVRAQKIDGFSYKTFVIVIASFQILNKLGAVQIFLKTFLSADISMDMIFIMSFLTFSNANI